MSEEAQIYSKQIVTDDSSTHMREHAADAARLMILCMLAEGEQSVGSLNEAIPLSQSALSQQLARLRAQGIVETRRESQTIFYSLGEGPAEKIIHLLHDIYCPDGSKCGS